MKFLLVFVTVVIVAVQVSPYLWSDTLTEEQEKKLRGYHNECAAESGVNVQDIHVERYDMEMHVESGRYDDAPKTRSHLLCVSKKIGLQNAKGKIRKDVVTAKLTAIYNEDLAKPIVDECAKDEDTPEDTAFNSLKCYLENIPDNIPLV